MLYLSLVNRDPQHSASVEIRGIERAGEARMFTVAGDSPMALNTEDDSLRVTVDEWVWKAGSNALQVPAHSFTMVVIPLHGSIPPLQRSKDRADLVFP